MPTTRSTYAEAFAVGIRPERLLTVSEWADEHRYLSDVASSEPGRWRTSRTPYLREVMDQFSAQSPTERVVFQAAAQLGKTETINNITGYVIDHSPGPLLMVLPTVQLAQRASKQRVAPMIRTTPVLRDKVSDPKSRDSGNTIEMKEFEGGILILTGANSAAGLRAMPMRRVLMDEVDAYPHDVDGEGDPIALAEKRTSNFAMRKIGLFSTPTLKHLSAIAAEYEASDQRRYYVPCPHCGHMDWITWRDAGRHRIEWDEGEPWTARLVCGHCGERVDERHKRQMLEGGEWRATAVSQTRTVGYQLSALYSPWKRWGQCAEEFLVAKRDRTKLQVWVNTVMGETWEEEGDSITTAGLRAHMERYAADVPAGVGALVCAVDVQGDRLEAAVWGYGAGEESWLIALHQIYGNPAQPKVWQELDAFRAVTYTTSSGREVRIDCMVIDSGGAHTENVYVYVAAREGQNIFAIKGGTLTGKPLVERPTRNNKYRVPLYMLCTDTGKEVVLGRLMIPGGPGGGPPPDPLPGYVHLPEWIDDESLEQLRSERAVRKYVRGRGAVRVWEKTRERNELLDQTVYALAGLYIGGPALLRSLADRAAAWAAPLSADTAKAPGVQVRPAGARRGGWMSGYK